MIRTRMATIPAIVERLLTDVYALRQEVAQLRQETAELHAATRPRGPRKRTVHDLADAVDQVLIERPFQTAEEIARQIRVRTAVVRETLERGNGVRFRLQVGPPGRSSRAKCWAVQPLSARFGYSETQNTVSQPLEPLEPSRGPGRVQGESV